MERASSAHWVGEGGGRGNRASRNGVVKGDVSVCARNETPGQVLWYRSCVL